MQGASFLAVKTEGAVTARARRFGAMAAAILLVLLTIAGIWVALGIDGYAVRSAVNMSAPSRVVSCLNESKGIPESAEV